MSPLDTRPTAQREALRATLASASLSDALDNFGVWSVLPPSIRHVGGASRSFLGRAYTISWGPVRKGRDIRAPSPSTWTHVRDFLAPAVRDGTGIVYVGGSVGGGVIDRFALAGGLSSHHFDNIGIEAMVLGGAMRDVEDLTDRRMPVWASGLSPADTQGNYAVVSAGTETMVADVRVRTGDWVFGDATGIVVIPEAIFDDVVKRALEIIKAESALMDRLKAGENLLAILETSGHI